MAATGWIADRLLLFRYGRGLMPRTAWLAELVPPFDADRGRDTLDPNRT